MAFALVQGGTSLYRVDLASGVATALTLPTGIMLDITRKPRFAILNQWVVMTNSPTRNLAIDPEGVVRVLVPRPPTHAPTLVAGSGTGLTGAYTARDSFVVLNSDGELLMESPLSPVSSSLTVANKDISYSDVQVSVDDVSARRVYRSTAGGSTYFHLLDHDGNTSESFLNNTSDATLELLAAATDLVTPPGTLPGIRFKAIVSWKSRLFAVADSPGLIDTIYVSDTNKIYAWPNTLIAYPTGEDKDGIVAFAPLRNSLGVLKRSGVWQISGTSSSTGIAIGNASISQIAYGNAGCIAPDSVVVVGDRAYWLGNDGVYEWDGNAVRSISDDQVAPWFTSSTYFNTARLQYAFARYNSYRGQYELHVAAAGSSSEDRWVSFNLKSRKWYGPHKTAAFTPSHAGPVNGSNLVDASGLPLSVVGGTDGIIYLANGSNYHDGTNSAIDFDVYTPFYHGDAPDIEHYWGELSVLTKVQGSGTLSITPTVGRLNASAQSAISHDMTKGRELLRRLGDGPLAQLRLRQATADVGVGIYGFELPHFENGRR